eukprot:3707431-Prymnesium_polylepis.1
MGLCEGSCHAAGKFLAHLVNSVDFEKIIFTLHHGIFLRIFREMWACPKEGHLHRAEPCELGECDAFLSHSWSDDGKLKWLVLSEYATAFKAKHGRLPAIWLDKAHQPLNPEPRASTSLPESQPFATLGFERRACGVALSLTCLHRSVRY